MFDPEAMGVFKEEMDTSSRQRQGRRRGGGNEIEIERLEINDGPDDSQSEEDAMVNRTRRTTTTTTSRTRSAPKDSGVFKNAMPEPYHKMPYTRTVAIEDDDEESLEESETRDRRGSDARARESPVSPSSLRQYEYESTNGHRQRSHVKREIVPDTNPVYEDDDDDDFTFQGQRMRIGQKKKKKGKLEGGKRFLKKVQHELEEQRNEWGSEVERMMQGSEKLQKLPMNSQTGGTNSFVDTSSGSPVYKAFFDVSEFPPESINVSIDKLTNKCVVQAAQGVGRMTKTFTQKVQLPRFADEARLTSRLSKKGILKVEVPLIYYFDESKDKSNKAKSFVNEIKTNPKTGRQQLEILVNTDPEIRAKDLHVQVEEDKLVILADTVSKSGKVKQKLIKQYTLPELADLDSIRSRLGRDGRLAITVPLKRVDRSMQEPPMPGMRTVKHEVTRQYHNGSTSPDPYVFQQMRYQTLEPEDVTRVSHTTYHESHTMPQPRLRNTEPIIYEPPPRQQYSSRVIHEDPEIKRVQIVKKTRKVRRT